MILKASDFGAFWHEIHGGEPFPWQQRLVDTIADSGRWPAALDIPTGLGKTSVLDIAVFTLALSLSPGNPHRLPRRIFLVIDRRVVVDQSFVHANQLGDRLRDPGDDPSVSEVAKLLQPASLARHTTRNQGRDEISGPPLVVGRMRGGARWAWRWLERPDQPAIIVGTIDQIGSRILFDGYGVGQYLRPIDAALTGADSLVLIDEAHLAAPFVDTVRAAQDLVPEASPMASFKPQIVVMSATVRREVSAPRGYPLAATSEVFTIDDADLEDRTVIKRMNAPKRLVALEISTHKRSQADETGKKLAEIARGLGPGYDVVGVVANTVAAARSAFVEIRKECPGRAILVTGLQREVDRDRIWQQWRNQIEAGRSWRPGLPLYVVATQTIEVGADLDFSALVTESASVDALIQRLGRLNRRGDWGDGLAVVVHPSSSDDQDRVYGTARGETWRWITGQVAPQQLTKGRLPSEVTDGKLALPVDGAPQTGDGPPDLPPSISVAPAAIGARLKATSLEEQMAMRMPAALTPVLFPGTLERWVRTSPRAIDTPPTGAFLHGFGREVPTVSVGWRCAAHAKDDAIKDLIASVELLPPSRGELIEIPIWSVAAWLWGERSSAAEVSDTTGVSEGPIEGEGDADAPVIAITADGEVFCQKRWRLNPGCTVIVPTWLGGLDEFGWAPESSALVRDIADLVEHRIATQLPRRRSAPRRTLRVDPIVLGQCLSDAEGRDWLTDACRKAAHEFETGSDSAAVVCELLAGYRDLLVAGDEMEALVDDVLVTKAGGRRVLADGLVVSPRLRGEKHGPVALIHGAAELERWSNEADSLATSASRAEVGLDVHQDRVADRARAVAAAIGLPEDLCRAVELAARYHDLGKLDPRFQRMLRGGMNEATVPLAKSGMDPTRSGAFRQARELSGYPKGMRHEAFSARLVAQLCAGEPERELIVHLVASHHGRARPLEGAVLDQAPITYTTADAAASVSTADGPDWDQPGRFRRLNNRFGPWGLAMLETIVRLSDIGCSAEGS